MGPTEQCSQGQKAQHISIPFSERSSNSSVGSHYHTVCFHLFSELKGFTLTGAGFIKKNGTNPKKEKKNPTGKKSHKWNHLLLELFLQHRNEMKHEGSKGEKSEN